MRRCSDLTNSVFAAIAGVENRGSDNLMFLIVLISASADTARTVPDEFARYNSDPSETTEL